MDVKSIQDIDKNFEVSTSKDNNVKYYSVEEKPFKIYGLPYFREEKKFCRFPQDKLNEFPEALNWLSWHTSGGRVRFVTNSKKVSLRVEITSGKDMKHMPRSGSSGFDIYIGSKTEKRFIKCIMPEYDETIFEGEAISTEMGMVEWTINMPLYNGVKSILIGVDKNATIEKAPEYTFEKPIVFYGSSITQGGCASRPGNAYPNIISRWLDADFYNLGFSGSAKGEQEMAKFISRFEMSALILDYDHNAPSIEHLSSTHEPFFKTIRAKNPKLPIIFITKPDFDLDIDNNRIRRETIYTTYLNAVNSGDRYVYFIDGETLFGSKDRDACTVDGIHPNDLGFMRMAEGILPTIKRALDII